MKNKKHEFLGLSLFMLLTISVQAQKGGDHVGNGGGVICIQGKCKTLAEAGLKISLDYPDLWLPDTDLVNDINDKISHFPFEKIVRERLTQKIFLNLNHFVKVDVVDFVKLNEITDFYKKTLLEADPSLDFAGFQLSALSSDNTSSDPHTFLLPSFFQLLNKDQQAQVLIHEGLYRGHEKSKLRTVLKLDTALFQFYYSYQLSNLSTDQLHSNAITAQIALYNLDLMSKGEMFSHLLGTEFSFGTITNFVKNPKFDVPQFSNFKIDYLSFSPFTAETGNSAANINKDGVLALRIDSRVKLLLLNLDLTKCTTQFVREGNFKNDIYPEDDKIFFTKYDKLYVIREFSKAVFVLPK